MYPKILWASYAFMQIAFTFQQTGILGISKLLTSTYHHYFFRNSTSLFHTPQENKLNKSLYLYTFSIFSHSEFQLHETMCLADEKEQPVEYFPRVQDNSKKRNAQRPQRKDKENIPSVALYTSRLHKLQSRNKASAVQKMKVVVSKGSKFFLGCQNGKYF